MPSSVDIAEHAEQQHHAGKTPGGRRLQRRKSGIDQIGDDLRRDRVHRDRREEEGGEQRPEGVVTYRALQGPAIVDEAGVGFLRDMRRAGGEHPPRQQQQRHQQTQRDDAEPLIGVAPADPVDQHLRRRQQHQDAHTGRGVEDRHRGRQSRAEPAAEQDRVRHIADQCNADPDAQSESKAGTARAPARARQPGRRRRAAAARANR